MKRVSGECSLFADNYSGNKAFGIEDGCREKVGIGRVQKRSVRVGGKRKAAVTRFLLVYMYPGLHANIWRCFT